MMAILLMIMAIGLPWLGALFVWWIGDKHREVQHLLAIGFSVGAGLASLSLVFFTTDQVVFRISFGGVFGDFTLIPDGLGVCLTIIATVIGSLAVIFSVDYMHSEAQLGRYYALMLFFIGAMAGLVLSGSILFMFFFWEITAFCSYALISFHNDDPRAVAGGIKALIITQLGGIGLLAGGIIAYTHLGDYEINTLLAGAGTLPTGVLSLIAFGYLAAAIAKSAQVPLHTWLPDAMEAPTPVSALIHAATMVNAGVYLIVRFYPAFMDVPGWGLCVVIVGLLSGLLGAIMALVANDLKRALAYSTISQVGYMFYAVGVGGIFASQFHLASHAVFKGLLFLCAGAVIHAVGTRDMRAMGGLGQVMPFVRNTFIIGSLALAGLPIANGFFSKELVLESGLAYGPLWAYLGMLIGAGLTATYTFRMVSMVFYGKSRPAEMVHDALPAMRFSLGLLAVGVMTSWLLAGPLSQLLAESLPFHKVDAESTVEIVFKIIASPLSWFTVSVILLGILAWECRRSLSQLTSRLDPITRFAKQGMGFEWINQRVIAGVLNVASDLAITQTGLLNWNLVGIVGGLVALLILLILGT
ncbi:MAG: NADH-quinone oxidoreductase subunit L [Anaerolineales bacterium]|nr:NADH-quinone oxidoreductase subunit L [Anaerolineales bacterium]